jgi:hypothetical protein
VTFNGAPRPNVPVALQVDYFHFGFGPGSERANLISSRCVRWCTPAGLQQRCNRGGTFASRLIDRSSPSSSGARRPRSSHFFTFFDDAPAPRHSLLSILQEPGRHDRPFAASPPVEKS